MTEDQAPEHAGLRVVIVDDHAMFRAGVNHEIGQHVTVVGEGEDVDTAVSSGDALRSALRGYSAGESATLTVSRSGETLKLTVTFDLASESTKLFDSPQLRRRVTAPPPSVFCILSFSFSIFFSPPSGKAPRRAICTALFPCPDAGLHGDRRRSARHNKNRQP